MLKKPLILIDILVTIKKFKVAVLTIVASKIPVPQKQFLSRTDFVRQQIEN